MDEDEDETMEQDDGDSAAQSDPRPAALPGSIPVTDCLFCSHHSKSLMKNLSHMTKIHSFFIPDVEFLVDLKGLIRYLGEPPLLLRLLFLSSSSSFTFSLSSTFASSFSSDSCIFLFLILLLLSSSSHTDPLFVFLVNFLLLLHLLPIFLPLH